MVKITILDKSKQRVLIVTILNEAYESYKSHEAKNNVDLWIKSFILPKYHLDPDTTDYMVSDATLIEEKVHLKN